MNTVLDDLQLPDALRCRIRPPPPTVPQQETQRQAFVLYLPTINLRVQHNPALALACRLANHWRLPLLILGVVLDDSHLPFDDKQPPEAIVATARRTAFVLQAYQAVLPQWSELGAGVCVRVHHNQGGRTPHHLSLARQATAVIVDEPFVHPSLCFVQRIEQVTKACFRVDGSTTVPPILLLKKESGTSHSGLPQKAWQWEQRTRPYRKKHVHGAVRHGDLDAPKLLVPCPANVLEANDSNPLQAYLPKDWLGSSVPAPGKRAWTLSEVQALDVVYWVQNTALGLDQSVPICEQTHGGEGSSRWRRFYRNSLKQYARKRNNIREPHSVSRMSCFLNFGTVSIFQIVHDIWEAPFDTSKFEEEVIKWREIGYAHALARPLVYFDEAAVPLWARRYMTQCQELSSTSTKQGRYSLEELASSCTGDATWDAMQSYLVETGELHNNARMSWGKTVVHWNKTAGTQRLLEQLGYLNDRYALDGLSPPSYAGLLWCLGWGDKQGSNGSITTKPASRYRVSPDGFDLAQTLLKGEPAVTPGGSSGVPLPLKKAKTEQGNKITAYFQSGERTTTIG